MKGKVVPTLQPALRSAQRFPAPPSRCQPHEDEAHRVSPRSPSCAADFDLCLRGARRGAETPRSIAAEIVPHPPSQRAQRWSSPEIAARFSICRSGVQSGLARCRTPALGDIPEDQLQSLQRPRTFSPCTRSSAASHRSLTKRIAAGADDPVGSDGRRPRMAAVPSGKPGARTGFSSAGDCGDTRIFTGAGAGASAAKQRDREGHPESLLAAWHEPAAYNRNGSMQPRSRG